MTNKVTTSEKIGIVYLLTNDCYKEKGLYKIGYTANPFQRKAIQSNSTPPKYPFHDEIIIFSKSYKQIEKRLKRILLDKNMIDHYEHEGTEWTKENADLESVLEVFKGVTDEFPDAEVCFAGRRYRVRNGKKEECKLPNCQLDLLGITDGEKITCTVNKKTFEVQGNQIVVEGEPKTLSNYIRSILKRNGSTNQFNGYRYFKYKGTILSEMWETLTKMKAY